MIVPLVCVLAQIVMLTMDIVLCVIMMGTARITETNSVEMESVKVSLELGIHKSYQTIC